MSDEKPKAPPTFTVEVAEGPNMSGGSDQARLAHVHDDVEREALVTSLEEEKARPPAHASPPPVDELVAKPRRGREPAAPDAPAPVKEN